MCSRARIYVIVSMILINVTLGTSAAWGQEALQSTLGVEDDREGADVLGAFNDSLKLLLIEHASRIAFQQKTRRELGGNFWTDYKRSVRIPPQ